MTVKFEPWVGCAVMTVNSSSAGGLCAAEGELTSDRLCSYKSHHHAVFRVHLY